MPSAPSFQKSIGIVTLLSDFGTSDGYVGAMKGVLVREHPGGRVLDVTHEVPPQDVVAGAFALAQSSRTFPAGTIHVAVVDPGVGSSRRALIVEHNGSLFIGPDNGLLSLAAPPASSVAWAIDRVPRDWPMSNTFHGRDLFARVAGRIAAGASIGDFSTEKVPDYVAIDWPAPTREGDALHGAVVHVDRFGNLVTNLAVGDLDAFSPRAAGSAASVPAVEVRIGGERPPLVATYSDVEQGRLLAYIGSAGFLEIAIRNGSAREHVGTGPGTRVVITRPA